MSTILSQAITAIKYGVLQGGPARFEKIPIDDDNMRFDKRVEWQDMSGLDLSLCEHHPAQHFEQE